MLEHVSGLAFGPGSAQIVGLIDAAGEPVAARGWGVSLVEPDSDVVTVRVLVSANDLAAAGTAAGSKVAVTGADVASFTSTQVKGTVVSVEAPTPEDREASTAFVDAYFGAISRGDPNERLLLGRLAPLELRVVVLAIDAVFDQTPGPDAGIQLHQVPAT